MRFTFVIGIVVTAALSILAILCTAAYAQTADTLSVVNSVVTIPYGNWIAAAAPLVGAILFMASMALLAYLIARFAPPWLQAALNKQVLDVVQRYAADAIEWGVQAVQGATKGKEVSINVGSEVVAAAVQHAVDTWPKAVIDQLGGAEGIKNEIIKRLEDAGVILPQNSSADDILMHPAVASIPERPR